MDQSKYINTFVDHCVGMIHEQLNSILQLKTHLKIVQEANASHDQTVEALNQEIETLKKELETNSLNTAEYTQTQNNARIWEESYKAMAVKMSHMDTLTSQYNEIKNKYIGASEELGKAKEELEKAKVRIQELEEAPKVAPKKVINTKEVTTTKSTVVGKPKEADDF